VTVPVAPDSAPPETDVTAPSRRSIVASIHASGFFPAQS
jgi:hypothetical protein